MAMLIHIDLCGSTGSTDYPPATNVPNPAGFDYFLGYNSQENAHNYYPYFLLHNKVSLCNSIKNTNDNIA